MAPSLITSNLAVYLVIEKGARETVTTFTLEEIFPDS